MALNISSGKLEHHKNPSGLHNKVNWLLVNSLYDSNHLYALRLIVLVHNESWEKAFWIAEMICKKHFERIKERYPEDWYWARNYVNKERKRNKNRKAAVEKIDGVKENIIDLCNFIDSKGV